MTVTTSTNYLTPPRTWSLIYNGPGPDGKIELSKLISDYTVHTEKLSYIVTSDGIPRELPSARVFRSEELAIGGLIRGILRTAKLKNS